MERNFRVRTNAAGNEAIAAYFADHAINEAEVKMIGEITTRGLRVDTWAITFEEARMLDDLQGNDGRIELFFYKKNTPGSRLAPFNEWRKNSAAKTRTRLARRRSR